MPRKSTSRAYDWVAGSPEERRGPQGRPRAGPKGLAVRQLDRVTVRALGRSLATWHAVLEVQGLPAHKAFDAVLSSYLASLDSATADRINRRAREVRRQRYGEAP